MVKLSATKKELLEEISALKKKIQRLEKAESPRDAELMALRESEEKYRFLFDSSGDAIFIHNKEGQILAVNRQACEQFGYTLSELISMTVNQVDSPAEVQHIPERIARLMEQGHLLFESVHQRKDGSFIPHEVNTRRIIWNGHPAIMSICRDITVRKQAEAALLASEERFQSLFNNMSGGVAVYKTIDNGEHFIFVDINKSGEKLSRVNRPEIIGKRVDEVLPGIKEMGLLEVFKQVWQTGEPQQYPVSLYYDNRQAQWFENYVYKLPSGEIVAVYDDATDRKQAELALRVTEENFRRSLDESPLGVRIVTLEGKTLYANSAILDIYGYASTEELEAIPVEKRYTAASYAEYKLRWEKRKQGIVVPADYIIDIIRKDGEVRHLQVYRKEILWNGEKQDQLIYQDITERKLTEEALKESEQKFITAFNANPVPGAISTMQEGRFLNVNDAFREAFSYSSKTEIIGKTSVELGLFANPSDRQSMIKDMEQTGKVNNRELKMVTKDGRALDLLFSAEPVLINNQQYLLTAAVDITNLKKAEEEKQLLEERLVRAEKMEALGLMAGGVAHDLNNVLGIVVGYAELLLSTIDAKNPIREDLVTIMEGGQRAAAIVEDMLTIARRGVAGRKILNLNKLINDLKKSPDWNKLLSHHPNVRIKTELEPDLLNISGSFVHLHKTLYNLVSNAAEAMTKGGTLTIKTNNQYIDKPISGYDTILEGDYVVLSVADEGEGISETDLKRIFEPFYTKKVMGRSGTGLGLSVVWGTIKDHQGYIDVQSEEGRGTTFNLYFLITREDIAAEGIAVSLSEYMGKGQSILVVDDVKKQRDLASRMLKSLNYNVASASSGEDAVEYLKDHKVDLLVLDMIMDPGMDGLDTYQSVLKINPKQKAIIVSGFSESDRVHDAQALGAGTYVKKPYVIEKLGMAVKKELDRL